MKNKVSGIIRVVKLVTKSSPIAVPEVGCSSEVWASPMAMGCRRAARRSCTVRCSSHDAGSRRQTQRPALANAPSNSAEPAGPEVKALDKDATAYRYCVKFIFLEFLYFFLWFIFLSALSSFPDISVLPKNYLAGWEWIYFVSLNRARKLTFTSV